MRFIVVGIHGFVVRVELRVGGNGVDKTFVFF